MIPLEKLSGINGTGLLREQPFLSPNKQCQSAKPWKIIPISLIISWSSTLSKAAVFPLCWLPNASTDRKQTWHSNTLNEVYSDNLATLQATQPYTTSKAHFLHVLIWNYLYLLSWNFKVLNKYYIINMVPSVLWRCRLGGRKGIWPAKKTEWWCAGVVICLKRGADLHMAQMTPLPLTVSCFSKIQIGFTFLVLAHLGSPGQRAVKHM